MFKELLDKLTTVLGISESVLDNYLILTWTDPEQPKTLANLKCIILNSWISNTCSDILTEIQPLVATGWTTKEADFYPDDSAMLLTEFKIDASKLKEAPRGILIHRKGTNTTDVLKNLK